MWQYLGGASSFASSCLRSIDLFSKITHQYLYYLKRRLALGKDQRWFSQENAAESDYHRFLFWSEDLRDSSPSYPIPQNDLRAGTAQKNQNYHLELRHGSVINKAYYFVLDHIKWDLAWVRIRVSISLCLEIRKTIQNRDARHPVHCCQIAISFAVR